MFLLKCLNLYLSILSITVSTVYWLYWLSNYSNYGTLLPSMLEGTRRVLDVRRSQNLRSQLYKPNQGKINKMIRYGCIVSITELLYIKELTTF
uniref:Secreted protein n=1 Tax=Heterorhabditis bacteriophora TaxID=37862 RepID=A0A1I7X946_HETBA